MGCVYVGCVVGCCLSVGRQVVGKMGRKVSLGFGRREVVGSRGRYLGT
jgi:hypothetical protein